MLSTDSPGQEHTVSFLREVLSRLAAFKLPPTPENFAWIYRQLQREHNLPVPAEYVNDLAILEHAIGAFDQLFVADAWLNVKLNEVRETITAAGIPEARKRQEVKQHLEEVLQRKEELLYHLAESSLALKSSVGDVVREITRLSSSVGGFQSNLSKYQELVDNCHDLADARRVMALVAQDTRQLNQSLAEHERLMGQSFSKLQESSSVILSNLATQANAGTSAPVGALHAVSPTAIGSEQLLRRVREPDFAQGVLMLVELAASGAADDANLVKRFSELLATRVDRAMLLGYWGGAQFVFVMPNVGASRALVIAREAGKEVERLAREEGGSPLTFTYGIAGYQNTDENAQGFFKAFELASGNMRPMRDVVAA